MASFEPVRAIVRGLAVLRIISATGPVTVTEIVKQSALPLPTVIRILETLVAAGYAFRNPETLAYGVTAGTKALSWGFDATSRLVQIAQPLIETLRAQIGWPSNLATFDGDAMVIAYTNRNANGFSIPGRLGARIPLLATGVGLVQLAALPATEVDAVLAKLRKSRERWDSDPQLWKKLPRRLSAARRLGYALADESYLEAVYQSRIWSVAVPIMVDGRMEAALSSLILHSPGLQKRQLSDVLPALQQTAAAIAAGLAADAGMPIEPKGRKRR